MAGSHYELLPPQAAANTAVVEAHRSGLNRLLVQMATGAGKTVAFAALLNDPRLLEWLEQFSPTKRSGLVLAHRKELIQQAVATIRRTNSRLLVSIEQDDYYANAWSDIVVASVQTVAASNFRRLKRLMKRMMFRTVIVDEAHHSAAASYRTMLVHLGFLPPADATDKENFEAADYNDVMEMQKALAGWDAVAPKDRLLIGYTATPNRSDEVGLQCVFQKLAFKYELREAIRDGYLVPPVAYAVTTDVSLDKVKTTAGELNQKQLGIAVNEERRNKVAVAAWLERARGLSSLAFCVTVEHAHAMTQMFLENGVQAATVTGETDPDERRAIIDGSRTGRIAVVSNCNVFTEGTDMPWIRCLIMAKPTTSSTLYEQMLGRGLRKDPKNPDKTECIVLDVVDIAKKHELLSVPTLAGLPPGLLMDGQTTDDAAEGLKALDAQYPGVAKLLGEKPLTLKDLKAKAERVKLWANKATGKKASTWHKTSLDWLKVTPDHFRLSYPWQEGTEALDVRREFAGQYAVVLTYRPNNGGPARQQTLATGLPNVGEGLKKGDQFVKTERPRAARMRNKYAGWRQLPASHAQLRLLGSMKVQFDEHVLLQKGGMGLASDMITRAKALAGR